MIINKENILHKLKDVAQKLNGIKQLSQGVQRDLDDIWEKVRMLDVGENTNETVER